MHQTLEELLQPHQEDVNYKWYLGPACEMSLHLDFSPLNQKKGGFKLATFGTANQDLLEPDLRSVPIMLLYHDYYPKNTLKIS